MDRRTFCLGSVASAVCRHADSAFAAANLGPAVGFDRILFDSRHTECRSFGAAARSSGYETAAFQGDVTQLWCEELRPRWAAGGGAIAGMTSSSSLFCLEQLAKDHWRRVVIRIEHRRSPAGIPSHRVTAAEPMLTRTCAGLNHPHAWPEQVMALFNTCVHVKNRPRSTCVIPRADAVTRRLAHADAVNRVLAQADLVSWVIAG